MTGNMSRDCRAWLRDPRGRRPWPHGASLCDSLQKGSKAWGAQWKEGWPVQKGVCSEGPGGIEIKGERMTEMMAPGTRTWNQKGLGGWGLGAEFKSFGLSFARRSLRSCQGSSGDWDQVWLREWTVGMEWGSGSSQSWSSHLEWGATGGEMAIPHCPSLVVLTLLWTTLVKPPAPYWRHKNFKKMPDSNCWKR